MAYKGARVEKLPISYSAENGTRLLFPKVTAYLIQTAEIAEKTQVKPVLQFSLAAMLLAGLVGCGVAPKRLQRFVSCAEDGYQFSSLPVIHSNTYRGVIPMGDVDPANGRVFPMGEIFFQPYVDDGAATPPTYAPLNVVSPGDGMDLIAIRTRTYDAYPITEHTAFFKPCSTMRVFLEQINQLDAALRTRLDAANSSWANGTGGVCVVGTDSWGDYTECLNRFTNIELESGEAIGVASRYRPLGFGVYDQNVTVDYFTPNYYKQSLSAVSDLLGLNVSTMSLWEFLQPNYTDYLHASCALNYYPGEDEDGFPAVALVDHAGNSLGTWDGTNCGTFVEDTPGAGASGNWFVKPFVDVIAQADGMSALLLEQVSVALVHDRINLSLAATRNYPVFSIGTGFPLIGGALPELDAGRYEFTKANAGNVNRDFDALIIGEEYCYENLTRRDGATAFDGAFWLKLTSHNTFIFEAYNAIGADCSNTSLNVDLIEFTR